jgi:hypothetical protein
MHVAASSINQDFCSKPSPLIYVILIANWRGFLIAIWHGSKVRGLVAYGRNPYLANPSSRELWGLADLRAFVHWFALSQGKSSK